MKRIFLLFGLLAAGCSKKQIELAEPAPTLTVSALQDTYVIDQAAYIQVSITQRGYDGYFLLSAVVDEGACELRMNDTPISTDGVWIRLPQSTEMLTLVPRNTGWLRISIEVRAENGQQSGRSNLNLAIGESPALELEVESPTTASIDDPITLTATLIKAGFNGQLPVKFDCKAGTGTLQYGSIVIEDGATFACPANTEQTLYYTAAGRGIHRFQFTVTDGYTTRIAPVEIIVTLKLTPSYSSDHFKVASTGSVAIPTSFFT